MFQVARAAYVDCESQIVQFIPAAIAQLFRHRLGFVSGMKLFSITRHPKYSQGHTHIMIL